MEGNAFARSDLTALLPRAWRGGWSVQSTQSGDVTSVAESTDLDPASFPGLCCPQAGRGGRVPQHPAQGQPLG